MLGRRLYVALACSEVCREPRGCSILDGESIVTVYIGYTIPFRLPLHDQSMLSNSTQAADMTPSAADTTIFEDVVNFTGDDFIDYDYVVLQNRQSVRLGTGSSSPLDSSVERISKPGCTLLPGLIDCHLHGLIGMYSLTDCTWRLVRNQVQRL